MFGQKRTRVLAVAALLVLMVTSPGDSARLPRLLCDVYRGLFLLYGCVDRHTHICSVINKMLTRQVNHRPACDYFPCRGYGSNVGRCVEPLFCLLAQERNGICNIGRVCCRGLLADGDSSSLEISANSTMVDDSKLAGFPIGLDDQI